MTAWTKPFLLSLCLFLPVSCTAVPDPGAPLSPPVQRLLIVGNITFLFLSMITALLLLRRRRIAVRLRETELQVQLCQAQLEPHFIYNALSVLGYYIHSRQDKKAEEFLGDFSQLLRRYLENSSKLFIPLADELHVLERFLRIQTKRYDGLFDYSIRISPSVDIDRNLVFPMLLQPFAENAVEHGFRNLRYKGFLLIEVAQTGTALLCTLEDNGNGMGTGNKLHPADQGRHALDITKDRLHLLNKFYPGAYTLRIEDLTSEGRQGVRVSISIPLIR